jgi:hypothetical protein
MKLPQSHQIKNKKGQLVVEAVLLMVLMLSIAAFVTKWLKDSEFAEKLAVEPLAKLSGMIQCGAWAPCGIDQKKAGLHPNSARMLSLNPQSGGT